MNEASNLGKALIENFEAFKKELPILQREHKDKGLLYRDGELVKIFDTVGDAVIYAQEHYPDGQYLTRRCNASELCETVEFVKGPGHQSTD